MEKVERTKNLLKEAEKLRTLEERFAKAKANPKCDKYELEFSEDNRFSIFTSRITLSGYTGVYGSSSCYTFDFIDPSIATNALLHVLNNNRESILQQMADYISKQAHSLKSEVLEELEEAKNILDSLEEPK